MDNNEILAGWQGWRLNPACGWINPNEPNKYKTEAKVPDYPNDAAACDTLLDTLVEKGYSYTLEESKDGVVFVVSKVKWSDTARLDFALTCREAVVAACLEVTRKES